MQIPLDVADITSAWLDSALRQNAEDARLSEATLLDSSSGTNGRARFGLTWSGQDAHKMPRHVFIKMMPADPDQRAYIISLGTGPLESRFYAQIARDVPILRPNHFYSGWEQDGSRYAIVMEDLLAAGGRPAMMGQDSTYDTAEQVVTSLAKLHAAFWNSPRFTGDLSWLGGFFALRLPLIPDAVVRSCSLLEDWLPPLFGQAGELFIREQHRIADLFENDVPTLVHGDAHLQNLFKDKDGKVGFLDWQLCAKMPYMFDLAYTIGISFPPDVRRKAETELLPLYREIVMREAGIKLDPDEMWEQYRTNIFYSWIASAGTFGTGERMQPLEWSLRALKWSTQAIDDLDTLGIIQHRLRKNG